MQKILFLSVMNGSAWGGSEELWYQAALWTARNNYEVDVCCFDSIEKSNRMKELEEAGCRLFLLPGKEETKKQLLLGKIKLSKAITEIPFEEYHQVIVSQGGWKDVTHSPFKKLYKRLQSYVLIYHNYNINEKFSLQKYSLLQKWANKASKNLGATPKIFQALEQSYSLNIPNQGVIFNPLTFPIPKKATGFLTSPGKKVIFCMLAALDTERKAQDVLLQALAMEKWKERNWELNLYGEGKDKPLLEKMIAQLQLQSKVFLRGHTQHVQQVIAQVHLVLQITHMDGMPISVMEAMSMARPVVVSNVGDMPLWIKEDLNGWVTGEVTTDSIDKTLEKAWNQQNDWEEMGKRSFAIFQRDFPPDPVNYFLKQPAWCLFPLITTYQKIRSK